MPEIVLACPECGSKDLEGDNDEGFICLSCGWEFFLETAHIA